MGLFDRKSNTATETEFEVPTVATYAESVDLSEVPKSARGGGRHRDPNPYDEAVQLSYSTGQWQRSWANSDTERDRVTKLVQRSAKYAGYGVEFRYSSDAVFFFVRDKRERKSKETS